MFARPLKASSRSHRLASKSRGGLRSRPALEALEGRALRAGGLTVFPLPTPSSVPDAIVAGPDGNLWFTEGNTNAIGRIAPDGTLKEFALALNGRSPSGITVGPDGALWFTRGGFGGSVGRITTGGTIAEFDLPTPGGNPIGPGSDPRAIVAGPDGNLWLTELLGGTIDRITPQGVLTVFPIPTPASGPLGIAAGPDGALWFTESGASKIGRITTGGTITEFASGVSEPAGIAAGPDGALWYTGAGSDAIGRITTGGEVHLFPVPTASARPVAIVPGPGGALWFLEQVGNQVGRITADGTITEFPLAPTPPNPFGENGVTDALAAAPDGTLWITARGANAVERLATDNAFFAVGGALVGTTTQPLSGVVATIVDTEPGARSDEFSTSIDWGDGQTSPGTIGGGAGGVFTVTGAHSYAQGGTDAVTVTIASARTGATLTAHGLATAIAPNILGGPVDPGTFPTPAAQSSSGAAVSSPLATPAIPATPATLTNADPSLILSASTPARTLDQGIASLFRNRSLAASFRSSHARHGHPTHPRVHAHGVRPSHG